MLKWPSEIWGTFTPGTSPPSKWRYLVSRFFFFPGGEGGGNRSEALDRETIFSQLAKRSSQNVDIGVRNNKYFRSTSRGCDELRPEH